MQLKIKKETNRGYRSVIATITGQDKWPRSSRLTVTGSYFRLVCLLMSWDSPGDGSEACLVPGAPGTGGYPAGELCRWQWRKPEGTGSATQGKSRLHSGFHLQTNTSLAKAGHGAQPEGRGSGRSTAPRGGRRKYQCASNNSPNLTEGCTEEVSLDLGPEGHIGFFQVKMRQGTSLEGMKWGRGP